MVAILGSFVFGGIPIGLLVGRAKGIDDIRKYGSGNIGASNVLRVIGVKAGLFVWLMDAMKGLLPVLIVRCAVFPSDMRARLCWVAAVAVAAMCGHCFSVFLKFTGGRGVSTSLGVLIGMDWRVGLICFVCWTIIVGITRYISLGSMIATGLAAPAMLLLGAPAQFAVAGAAIGLIVLWRHVPNIARLLNGTERKIGQKERVATDAETSS